MDIFASGFNAHNQLEAAENKGPAKDVSTFSRIATGNDIKVLFAGWSCTIYTSDTALHTLGHIGATSPPLTTPQTITFPHSTANSTFKISSIHGSHNGPLGLLTSNGSLYTFKNTSSSLTLQPIADTEESPKISAIASTNTSQTSITFLQSPGSNLSHVLTFPTYDAFISFYTSPSWTEPGSYVHTMVPDRVKSLVAGATSFALLTEEGEVYSWGDPRYSRCLARTPSAEFPAEKPALVEVLGGIPISKIDTSGWMFGALSKEQDLYLWGSTKPGSNDDKGTRDLLGNGEEEIKLVEIEGVESVSDFGIGDGFIVVLAERGDIWVKGENENGQLGIGEGSKVVSEWTIVDRAQVGDANVVDVIVGELCTFLITSSRG